jgi:hypothetical protein
MWAAKHCSILLSSVLPQPDYLSLQQLWHYKTFCLWKHHVNLLLQSFRSVSFPDCVYPNPPCQLSLWEETGATGENPRLSAERWLTLFTWVRSETRTHALKAYLENLVTNPNSQIISGRFDVTYKNPSGIPAQNIQSQSLHCLIGRDIPWFTWGFHIIRRYTEIYTYYGIRQEKTVLNEFVMRQSWVLVLAFFVNGKLHN